MPTLKHLIEELRKIDVDPDEVRIPGQLYDDLIDDAEASRNAVINLPNLERFIEDIQKRLPELDFEGRRLALDMLDITVYLDNENVEIKGIIDTSIVLMCSEGR